MTHNPGDPSEQLRELLRRMEEIPDDDAPGTHWVVLVPPFLAAPVGSAP